MGGQLAGDAGDAGAEGEHLDLAPAPGGHRGVGEAGQRPGVGLHRARSRRAAPPAGGAARPGSRGGGRTTSPPAAGRGAPCAAGRSCPAARSAGAGGAAAAARAGPRRSAISRWASASSSGVQGRSPWRRRISVGLQRTVRTSAGRRLGLALVAPASGSSTSSWTSTGPDHGGRGRHLPAEERGRRPGRRRRCPRAGAPGWPAGPVGAGGRRARPPPAPGRSDGARRGHRTPAARSTGEADGQAFSTGVGAPGHRLADQGVDAVAGPARRPPGTSPRSPGWRRAVRRRGCGRAAARASPSRSSRRPPAACTARGRACRRRRRPPRGPARRRPGARTRTIATSRSKSGCSTQW